MAAAAGQQHGLRHPSRFFPRLSNEERDLDLAAGMEWRQLAADKGAWKSRVSEWNRQRDVELTDEALC